MTAHSQTDTTAAAGPPAIAVFLKPQLFAQSLAECLGHDGGLQVVGFSESVIERPKSLNGNPVQAALVDATYPREELSRFVKELRKKHNSLQIVFLLATDAPDATIDHVIDYGAIGFASLQDSPKEIAEALKRVCRYEVHLSPRLTSRLRYDLAQRQFVATREAALAVLTPRQLQIMRCLAEGMTVKEIAKLLHISPKSVDSHKYRIMTRLKIHDRVALARFAIREGLIEA